MKKFIVLAFATLLSAGLVHAEAATESAPAAKTAKKGKKAKKKKDDRVAFEKAAAKKIRAAKLDKETEAAALSALEDAHERTVELSQAAKATARSTDPIVVAEANRDLFTHQVEVLTAVRDAVGDEGWTTMHAKKGKKAKKMVKKAKKKKKMAKN